MLKHVREATARLASEGYTVLRVEHGRKHIRIDLERDGRKRHIFAASTPRTSGNAGDWAAQAARRVFR